MLGRSNTFFECNDWSLGGIAAISVIGSGAGGGWCIGGGVLVVQVEDLVELRVVWSRGGINRARAGFQAEAIKLAQGQGSTTKEAAEKRNEKKG